MSDLTAEVEALLQARADRLKARHHGTAEEAVAWVAEFQLGDQLYAIPLEQLRGAAPLSRVTPVPLAAAHVIGIFRYRGELIAALSLAALLGGQASRKDSTVLLVVEAGPGQRVALDCEEVPRPVGVSERLLEGAKETAGAPVRTVRLPGRRPLGLLDVSALLARGKEGLLGPG